LEFVEGDAEGVGAVVEFLELLAELGQAVLHGEFGDVGEVGLGDEVEETQADGVQLLRKYSSYTSPFNTRSQYATINGGSAGFQECLTLTFIT
jgi:hypothetical protein